MQPWVIGINHTTAPVALRERLAFAGEEAIRVLQALIAEDTVDEAVVLSTCNRTEFYLNADADFGARADAWLAAWRSLESEALSPALYRLSDVAAVEHLMRVASGLDSMVLGEPQILGQVKQAFALAQEQGTVKSILSRLFQQAFAVAKQVRSETEIGVAAVSVAFAAVQLARQIFPSLAPLQALIIGAGETSELVARHLHEQGVTKMVVANRTFSRAETLAAEFGGRAVQLADIPHVLEKTDIVISSTASPLPMVGVGAVERALKARKRQPMLLVDLAVPRDIEAEVGDLDDAFLYTVDDLQSIVARNVANRQDAARVAAGMVQEQAQRFSAWLAARSVSASIAAFREDAARQRDEAVQRAMQQLQGGVAAAAVIEELAHRLTNRLTHAPTRALNTLAASGDWRQFDALLDALGVAHEHHGTADADMAPDSDAETSQPDHS